MIYRYSICHLEQSRGGSHEMEGCRAIGADGWRSSSNRSARGVAILLPLSFGAVLDEDCSSVLQGSRYYGAFTLALSNPM